MKKKIFNKKLVLNKETVFNLNAHELNSIKGGGDTWPTATVNFPGGPVSDTSSPTKCTGALSGCGVCN